MVSAGGANATGNVSNCLIGRSFVSEDRFGGRDEVPIVVVAIYRSVVSFVVLLLLTRLMGKKQISQMTFFDYAVGITIGSITASISLELEETLVGIVSLATWSLLAVYTGWGALKSSRFEKLVQGTPTAAVEDGKILEENLYNELVTTGDLLMKLRENRVFHLDDVEAAFIEPDGKISVLLKGDRQPLTGKSAGIPVPPTEMTRNVIIDGQVQEKTLAELGYNTSWLTRKLRQRGINSPKDVIIAQVDGTGELWVDLKDDRVPVHKPQAKKLLLANLSKVRAELERLALETGSPRAQKLYSNLARQAAGMLQELESHLR